MKIKLKEQEENKIIEEKRKTQIIETRLKEIGGKFKYKINEKTDYFNEHKNRTIQTILNSELAALTKCQEIYDSLDEGQRWIDPDFGPGNENEDDFSMSSKCLYGYDGTNIPPGQRKPELIEWKDIKDIDNEAVFFSGGVESNDVCQGGLGDCWFISALSVIATKEYLLKGENKLNFDEDGKIDEDENTMLTTGVHPPLFYSFKRKGIYVFRFYKNFGWRYVLIDGKIPCQKGTNCIMYAKCRSSNEFWVPLIEKAYAKLHGSYSCLVGGFIDDGLVDLTGLVARKLTLDNNMLKDTEKLWQYLMQCGSMGSTEKTKTVEDAKKRESLLKNAGRNEAKIFLRNKTMLGCSCHPKGKTSVEQEVIIGNYNTGILASHAYAILDIFEVPKPNGKKRKVSRLLRIRNPWGRREWNGKWSDDSKQIENKGEDILAVLKKKYENTDEKIALNQEDGCFFMCFKDFRNIFNNIFICENLPSKYKGIRILDKWCPDQNGGIPIHGTEDEMKKFFENPQYKFNLKRKGEIVFTLLQKDSRLSDQSWPYNSSIRKACLLLFRSGGKNKLSEPEDFNLLFQKTNVGSRRELIFEKNQFLEAGDYIIIPAMMSDDGKSNIDEKGGEFVLEIYVECILPSEKNLESTDKLNTEEIKKLREADKKYLNEQTNELNLPCGYIKKVNNLKIKSKIKLIEDYIPSAKKAASLEKEKFILENYQYMGYEEKIEEEDEEEDEFMNGF